MRAEFQESVELLLEMGFNLCCTRGTSEYYSSLPHLKGRLTTVTKPGEHSVSAKSLALPSAVEWIQNRRIDLVINIPEGSTRREEVSAGYLMRRAAVDYGAGLLTNMKCVLFYCDVLSLRQVD